MSDSAPVIADLDRAQDAVGHLVRGVAGDQWTLPTPCPDWNVRQLVSHLVGGHLMFAAVVSGDPRPDRTADHLGDDPVAAIDASGAALRNALLRPGVFENMYPTPIGDQSGEVVAHIRVHELMIHGWDLARATGQPATVLPDDLAERDLAQMRGAFRHGRPEAMFGPEKPAPDDAPAIERYAAFLGREL